MAAGAVDFAFASGFNYPCLEMQYDATVVATLQTPSSAGGMSSFGGSVYYLSNRSEPLSRYSDLAGKRVSFSRAAHVASIAFEAANYGLSLWQDLEAIIMTSDDGMTLNDVLSGFSDAGTMRSDQLAAIQGDCEGCVAPGTLSVVVRAAAAFLHSLPSLFNIPPPLIRLTRKPRVSRGD